MKRSEAKKISVKKLVATRLLLAVGAIVLCALAAYFAAVGVQDYQWEQLSRVQAPDLGEIDVHSATAQEMSAIYACIFYFDENDALVSQTGYEFYVDGDTRAEVERFLQQNGDGLQTRTVKLSRGTALIVQDTMLYSFGVLAKKYDTVLWIAVFAACGCMIVILLTFVHAVYRPVNRDFESLGVGIESAAPDFKKIDETQLRLAEAQTLARRYNAAVARAESEQREKRRAQETGDLLVSNLAHDLKSPITVLKGYADLLAQGEATPQETRSYVARICKSTNELRDLVDVLFEQMRYRSGEAVLHKRELDVCEVLRDCCANYYMLFEKRGFRFRAEIPDRHFFVQADRLALERVFGNLLRNILDHNPTPCVVRVSCEAAGAAVVVHIDDDGAGIPADSLPQLFEPFYRADRSRTDGGHRGLGLFAVRQIVEQHGGEVRAESPDGRGASFTIRLPACSHAE